MYVPHHFLVATYDTQSIDITSTSGEVCVMCTFSTNTTAVGCELQLRNNIMTLSRMFNGDVNIAEGCISNIITGYYDLYVYDIENDNTLSQLPAIIKNQVFVDEQTTTTSTTIVTTTGSIATTESITTTTGLIATTGSITTTTGSIATTVSTTTGSITTTVTTASLISTLLSLIIAKTATSSTALASSSISLILSSSISSAS